MHESFEGMARQRAKIRAITKRVRLSPFLPLLEIPLGASLVESWERHRLLAPYSGAPVDFV